MNDIESKLEAIKNRQDLSEFLIEIADRVRSGSLEWENSDPVTYLEALSAWISDMDGYLQNRGEGVPANPTWQMIARIIVAASMYE